MSRKELARHVMNKVVEYGKRYTPTEYVEKMIADKIINRNGDVLVTKKEKEQGYPDGTSEEIAEQARKEVFGS